VFDSYDHTTDTKKQMEDKRRVERERLFNRFASLRKNTIDPELNEVVEAAKARGHHAEVCETQPSEQSPPAVHLVVAKAGELKDEWPANQNRLTFRPEAGYSRDGGSVVILDSTKGNSGDPIEVANVPMTALSRQVVADRAIEFVARAIILPDTLFCPSQSNRSTADDAPRSTPASSAISEPQPRLAELMNRWWQARDSGNTLLPDEQAELETLAQAELGAGDDSARLFSDSDRSAS
jgi:hypothetical protein